VLEVLTVGLLVALRSLGVVLVLPSPGGGSLPNALRGGLVILVSALLAPGVAAPAGLTGRGWESLVIAGLAELMLGFVMGFVVRIAFSIAALGGRLIANEIGLNSPPGFDVPTPSQEPLPSLLTAFSGVMFFSLGLHHDVLAAFSRSFDVCPVGRFVISVHTIEIMTRLTSDILAIGLSIAAPYIALSFVVNVAFGLMGRAVPRINVYVESVSLRLAAGLLFLAGSGVLLWRNLDPVWHGLARHMLEVSLAPVR